MAWAIANGCKDTYDGSAYDKASKIWKWWGADRCFEGKTYREMLEKVKRYIDRHIAPSGERI